MKEPLLWHHGKTRVPIIERIRHARLKHKNEEENILHSVFHNYCDIPKILKNFYEFLQLSFLQRKLVLKRKAL